MKPRIVVNVRSFYNLIVRGGTQNKPASVFNYQLPDGRDVKILFADDFIAVLVAKDAEESKAQAVFLSPINNQIANVYCLEGSDVIWGNSPAPEES